MRKRPRILVIDDLYGRGKDGRNEHREDFCFRLGLQDVTSDVWAEQIDKAIAEVIFHPGQRTVGGYVENDLSGTLDFVRQGWTHEPRWALLLLDLHFKTGALRPDGEPAGTEDDRDPHQFFGLSILEQLAKDVRLCEIPVVILSSMSRNEIEERFTTHEELWDFVDKNDLNRYRLKTLLDDHALLEDERIIGRSIPLLKCLREARHRARSGNDNILILGETGTGKELLAQYIHKQSRRPGDFVTFLTNTVADTLVESSLFGHTKDAFTGAKSAKPGAAELADQGTLFIDEFGNMPGAVQQKLMRLLDKNVRETQRQGSHEVKKVDLQVVLATNRMDMLNADDFHQDLLARVKVRDPIVMPPLRERADDIPVLANFFLKKYEQEFSAEHRTISDEAMDALKRYPWPDNVRGLELMIEQAVSRYRGLRSLSLKHLNFAYRTVDEGPQVQQPQGEARTSQLPHVQPSTPATERDHSLETLVSELEQWPLGDLQPTALAGQLPNLQIAYARLLARFLNAALEATRKPTPENPEGDIEITPALKLITGKGKLSTSKAADYVKRLLKIAPESVEPLLDELPALREAHETALQLRPTRPHSKKKKS